jgi:hypothetical protein
MARSFFKAGPRSGKAVFFVVEDSVAKERRVATTRRRSGGGDDGAVAAIDGGLQPQALLTVVQLDVVVVVLLVVARAALPARRRRRDAICFRDVSGFVGGVSPPCACVAGTTPPNRLHGDGEGEDDDSSVLCVCAFRVVPAPPSFGLDARARAVGGAASPADRRAAKSGVAITSSSPNLVVLQ